jgi:hypothetical protein
VAGFAGIWHSQEHRRADSATGFRWLNRICVVSSTA